MNLLEQILRRAWAMIEDPAHWTTGTLHRDEDGLATYSPHCPTFDPDLEKPSVCWCAAGAVCDAAYELAGDDESYTQYWQQAWALLDQAALALYDAPVASVNDTMGHDAVRHVYERAFDLAQQRPNSDGDG